MHVNGKWISTMALAAFLLAGAASLAHAGWWIQEADPEFPDEVTTYWFQAGKVRVEGALEGLTMLIDLKKGEGYLVDPATKRYAGGMIADLAEQLKKLETEDVEGTAEEGTGGKGGASAAEQKPAAPEIVEVRDLGPGERLLGHETRHHQVRVGGDLIEELWVAPKIDVEREIDLVAFAAAMQKMLGGGDGANQGYEQSPEYRKVRKSGYPLRQALYFVGEKSLLAVKKVELKGFSDATFALPSGFAKVDYLVLLVGETE